jgi:hypothetical protein
MASRSRRSAEQIDAFRVAYAESKHIPTALLAAGHSEAAARRGRASLSAPLRAIVAELDTQDIKEFAAKGKHLNPEVLTDVVKYRLARNTVDGKDAGTLSAKQLGSLKDLNMFTADVAVGVQVNVVPADLKDVIRIDE